jgi:hypothetical protein
MHIKRRYSVTSPCPLVPLSPCRTGRRGAIVVWLPLALLASLGIIALAINYTRLWTIRVEMQSAADAAALACADTLVGDDLLRGTPSALPHLIQTASAQAIQYAANNAVLGQPFVLLPNPDNLANGDIVFGTLDRPRGSTFAVAANVSDPTNTALATVNAVLINARLTRARGNAPSLLLGGLLGIASVDIHAASAAMLDRDVIGFRPLGQQPLKLAPLAIFSDPTGKDSKSWQYQIEEKNAPDNYRYDAATHMFVLDAAGDGLPEMPALHRLQRCERNQPAAYHGRDARSACFFRRTAHAGRVGQPSHRSRQRYRPRHGQHGPRVNPNWLATA